MDTKTRMVVARDWGEEEAQSCCLMAMKLQLCKMDNFSRSNVDTVPVANNTALGT